MNSKGFTLIELLAVIVILAIIALIATPIVLGIINDSKESSNGVSATYMIDAIEQSYGMVYALNSGAIPKLDEVRERFNMENAEWVVEKDAEGKDKHIIRTLDGMVVCEVMGNQYEFYVKCPWDLETIKMAITPSTNG